MKNFLFNFKTKPTLFTLFIIIGFLCCLAGLFWIFNSVTSGSAGGWAAGLYLFWFLVVGISLIPAFIIYRFIIKHFKTKHIFITESLLIILFMLVMLIDNLSSYQRHLIIDQTNYSENYFLVISGEVEEQKETDRRLTPFLTNYEAVLHENYFFSERNDMGNAEIIYPKNWQVSTEDSIKQNYHSAYIQSDPFMVDIFYNDTFDYSYRALDSLATLVVYARQHDIPLSQANIELVNVWAEMNYIYSTFLEPYVKTSKADLHYIADTTLDPNLANDGYEKFYEEWGIKNAKTPPSDYGIHLSYTSHERIMEDIKLRAEQNNWPEKKINELTEYYATRMPVGYFRLHIERPTEELAHSDPDRFRIDGGFLPINPAQPPIGSSSNLWTNTMIFRKYGKPESTFQVVIAERFFEGEVNGVGEVNEEDTRYVVVDSFTFDMKRN